MSGGKNLHDDSYGYVDEHFAESAADLLNATLNKSTPSTIAEEEIPSKVIEESITPEDARIEAPVLIQDESREKIRVLFITKDASILQEGSSVYRRVVDSRSLFLEIHIILLAYSTEKKETIVLRLFENIWIYTTYATSWWKLSYKGYVTAESQLVFSGGFRADVIVVEDPFESGLAGCFLSRKYNRPYQLHLYEDFYDKAFVDLEKHPTFYTWSVQYVLGKARTIRTKTESQRRAVIDVYPKQESVTELLPTYYNLKAWQDFTPTMNLRELYPQFKFFILHISSMQAISHSREVLQGSAKILRMYPTVGLVMVGNGPLRPMLERLAIALGIQNQVEFIAKPLEVISLMKSANILVHLSEDTSEDDILLEAASVKLPLIASTEGLSGKLFVDNESACLCPPTDIACVSNRINQYLNENQDRARLAMSASDIVFDRIEQDYDAYLRAYCESVERCIDSSS